MDRKRDHLSQVKIKHRHQLQRATKPDLIQPDSLTQSIAMLKGKRPAQCP